MALRMSSLMLSKKFRNVAVINTNTLDKWLKNNGEKKNIVLLDCREKEEFDVSHLPGAIRIDFQDDAHNILRKIPIKDSNEKTVVCYCSIGYRASFVVDKVQNHFKETSSESGKAPFEMFNLEGSLFKWASEGKNMVDNNDKITPNAHPYNAFWGRLFNVRNRKST